jgi:hypothetical protein
LCKISQVIHKVHENEEFNLFDVEQSGFDPGRTDCVEHHTMENELINDADNNGKSIYILRLDFRNAFSTVSYDLIESNSYQIGFSESIRNIVMCSYRDVFINIQTQEDETECIHIGKESRRGYSLNHKLSTLL